jgi:hypothetical protein
VSRKPLSIGFEEIADDKIVWAEPKPPTDEETVDDGEEAAVEGADA